MPYFNDLLYPLIRDNKKLFDFYTQKAVNGCWIMPSSKGNFVAINRDLSNILGQNIDTINLERIIGPSESIRINKYFKRSAKELNTYTLTRKVYHSGGAGVVQHINFFYVENGNEQFLIGAHQNVTREYEYIEEMNKFGNIIKGTNLGTWEWNVQTGETRFNQRWAEIIGYSLEELEPVSIETWMNFAHADDLKESGKKLEDHFNGKTRIYEFESRMKHKDGHWVWVLDRGRVFTWTDDGKPEWMIGSHQDITEMKEEQLEIKHYQEILSSATKKAVVGVWEVDLEKEELYWDEVTREIHEVPDDFIPDLKTALDFYPEGLNREIITKHFNQAVNDNIAYDLELQIESYNKKVKWVRAIGIPELKKGKCIRVIGLFQNIDKIKKVQERTEEMSEITQEQNNRLVNFAHIVSHNLRSHSNNYSMLSNLLKTDLTDERRDKVYNMLVSASHQLKETIKHLDEVVDVNLNLKDNFTNLKLNKYIESAVSNLVAIADRKEISIQHKLNQDYFVYGLPAYLESMTLNFITNAIKYSDPKKENKYLVISAEKMDDEVLVHFEDNGVGINLEKNGEKLFGLYKTFHNLKNEESRGIGLFITKNQVEAMGGKIEVKSEVGQGTTFTVRLQAKIIK